MRISTASVIVAALSLGTPAFVQAQGAPSQPEAQTSPPPAQSGTMIRSVQVVEVKDLTPAVRLGIEYAYYADKYMDGATGKDPSVL